jgi:hypothetical protein
MVFLHAGMKQSGDLFLHQRCYLKVEKNKIDFLSHIIVALRPSRVFILMGKAQFKATANILKMYDDCLIQEISDYITFIFKAKHRTAYKTVKKDCRSIVAVVCLCRKVAPLLNLIAAT